MTKKELQKKIDKLEGELANSAEKHVTDASKTAKMLEKLSEGKCPADYGFYSGICGGCLVDTRPGKWKGFCWLDFAHGEFQDCSVEEEE